MKWNTFSKDVGAVPRLATLSQSTQCLTDYESSTKPRLDERLGLIKDVHVDEAKLVVHFGSSKAIHLNQSSVALFASQATRH